MRFFSKTLKSAALLAAFTAAPLAASAETLKDALRGAYNHSGLLQQNRALLRAADEDVAQAVSTLRPVISWSAAYNYSAGTQSRSYISADLSLSWEIYDFGRRDLNIGAVKERLLATRSRLVSIEQDVLLRAANAYFDYRLAVETKRLTDSNVRLIRKELQAANDRFEVGEITRTDVSLAEARLASARAAAAGAKGQVARASAEFISAVGRKPQNPKAAKSLPKVPSSVSKAVSTARRNHPSLIEVGHSINEAELVLKRAKLSHMPTVKVVAGISMDTLSSNGNGASLTGRLEASGAIYQGGQLASLTRQAAARRDAARAQLHNTRHQVDQGVRVAYANLDVARATRNAANQEIKAAEVAYRGVREEATLGSRTTLDVLNAEQELLDARTNRLSAGVDQQKAGYAILAAMGKMTATALRLGVKQYDPAEYYNLVKDAPAAKSKQGRALDRVINKVANGN